MSQEASNQLAIAGGPPVRTARMPSWPMFDEEMIEVVSDVLRSGKVNQWTGEKVHQFEQAMADRVDCRHAIAVANGTIALEVALFALGIGPGDEVITSPRTFIASASACVMRGATPVFADVDPSSGNISADSIRAVLTERARAIIPVHLGGWPCEMGPIMELARAEGLKVIEDCAQGLGAKIDGKPVGSFGDAACFSFCQDKIMTTGGEGGAITTNDPEIWEKAWSFKDHGKSRHAVENPDPTKVFQWLHHDFGTNGRMTEMQAAIGLVALDRLTDWLECRRRNAEILIHRLSKLDCLSIHTPPKNVTSCWYKFYACAQLNRLRGDWTRDRVVQAIQAEGIPCGSGSCSEIYLEKAFDGTPSKPAKRLPVAQELGDSSLMLLVHPTLEEQDMHDTADAVEKVLAVATT